MSEQTFCEMILAYAGFNSAKTKKLLKNIANIYTNETSKVRFSFFINSFFTI